MSEIKLKPTGGGAGSVSLKAPAATTGNADVPFVLPVADGSANQLLKTDGSKNLGWATDAGGLFASYAILEDQKSQNTSGGTSATGSWEIRDLNTEVADPDGIVSISSNKFTLGAGTYFIRWDAPAYKGGRHQSRLYDVTNTAVVGYGRSAYSSNSAVDQNGSHGRARVTISGSTEYRVEHQVGNGLATHGHGVESNYGTEVYTVVEIFKEA